MNNREDEIARIQVKERYSEAKDKIYDVFTISYGPTTVLDLKKFTANYSFKYWKQFEIERPYKIKDILEYLHRIVSSIENDLSTKE